MTVRAERSAAGACSLPLGGADGVARRSVHASALPPHGGQERARQPSTRQGQPGEAALTGLPTAGLPGVPSRPIGREPCGTLPSAIRRWLPSRGGCGSPVATVLQPLR